MATDAAGVALGEGMLRRFGGTRYRAHEAAILYPSNGGGLASLNDTYSDDWQILTFRDVDTGQRRWQQRIASSWSKSYALSADLKKLVHGKDDAQLIDPASGAVLARRAGLSPPYVFAGKWVVGLRKKQLVAWDADNGAMRPLATLAGAIQSLGAAAAAAVVVAIERTGSRGRGHNVRYTAWMFDLRNGKRRRVPLDKEMLPLSLAVEAAGGYALVARGARIMRLEMASNKPTLLLTVESTHGVLSLTRPLLAAAQAFAVATSGPKLLVFDARSGAIKREIPIGSKVKQLVMEADGETVAVLTALGEVRRFHALTGDERPRPAGHTWLSAAAIDDGAEVLVTAGTQLDVWDVDSGQHRRGRAAPGGIVDARLLSNNKLITMGQAADVRLWDLSTLTATTLASARKKPRYGRFPTIALAVDRQRQRAAFTTAGADSKRADDTLEVVVVDADGVTLFDVHSQARALAFAPNGHLAVAQEGDVTIYDGGGVAQARHLHSGPRGSVVRDWEVLSLAFSPDSQHLAMVGRHGVEVWNISRDELVRGWNGDSTSAAFLDAKHVLVAHENGAITTLSLGGPASRTRKPFVQAVAAMRVTRRGVLLASHRGPTLLVKPSWLLPEEAAVGKGESTSSLRVNVKLVGTVQGATSLKVVSGYRHMDGCAQHGGTVSCWGDNHNGGLGLGDNKRRDAPEALAMAALLDFDLAEGRGCGLVATTHGVAGGAGGRLFCWGRIDARGGRNTKWKAKASKPRRIEMLNGDARSISLSSDGWCAVMMDGRVDCLQQRQRSIYGRRQKAQVATVAGLRDAVRVANGDGHSCAIDTSDQVWCWGGNGAGQLGYGRASSDATVHAVAVVGLSDAKAIALGHDHTCALRASGRVACWGAGGVGQLGDGRTVTRPWAANVPGIVDATFITAGARASCALVAGGRVRCWGLLATQTKATEIHPLPVTIAGLSDVVALDTSGRNTCSVTRAENLSCWGAVD